MEYVYRVKTRDGREVSGTIDAPTEDTAVETLLARGFMILDLEAKAGGLFAADVFGFLSRPKGKDVVVFTRQLSTLIEADVPLAEGLRVMSKQIENASFRKIVGDIADAVEGGSALSNAFAAHPKLFSQFYVKLIRSGEASGRLGESLAYLADYLERNQAIAGKIRNALAYPVFVVFAMVVVALIMSLYVLPQLLNIFKEAGVTDLPVTTRALISMTDFMNAYALWIIAGLIAIVLTFWRYISTPDGHRWFDGFKLKAPIFGAVLRNLYLARLSENMATLIRADISILDTLRITSDIVGNEVYSAILLRAEEIVRGGGSISDAFRGQRAIPPLLVSMMAIGERTGKMQYMLDHAAKFYKTDAETSIDSISTLIEPVLVLVLGAAVAVLVASILLPLYGLVSAG